MDTKSFSSDITYCSVAEKLKKDESKTSNLNKHSSSNYHKKYLNEIYKKVERHFSGIELIEKMQVVLYLKELAKMNCKSCKSKYIAEKLQASLIKIYRSIRSFEKSFVLEQIQNAQDSLVNCNITKDMKIKVKKKKQDFFEKSFNKLKNSESLSINDVVLTNNNFGADESSSVLSNISKISNARKHDTSNLEPSRTKDIKKSKISHNSEKIESIKNTSSEVINPTQDSFIQNYQHIPASKNVFKKPVLTKRNKNKVIISDNKTYNCNCDCRKSTLRHDYDDPAPEIQRKIVKYEYKYQKSPETTSTQPSQGSSKISSQKFSIEPSQISGTKSFKKISNPTTQVSWKKSSKEISTEPSQASSMFSINFTKTSQLTDMEIDEALQTSPNKNEYLKMGVLEQENQNVAYHDPILEDIKLNIQKMIEGRTKVNATTLKEVNDKLTDICNNKTSNVSLELIQGTKNWENVTEELEYICHVKQWANENIKTLFENMRVEKRVQIDKDWEELCRTIILKHGYIQEDAENLGLDALVKENANELEKMSQECKVEMEKDDLLEISESKYSLTDEYITQFAKQFREMCSMSGPKDWE